MRAPFKFLFTFAVLALALYGFLAPAGARKAAAFSSPRQTNQTTTSHLPWHLPSIAYTIAVTADGLYALDFATLQGAGLPVGSGAGHLDPRTLKIFWMGQEIPIQVIGENDGTFDPGDTLLFYGRGIDSLYHDGRWVSTNKYTPTNIYWLTYGGGLGQRMPLKDSPLASASPATPYSRTLHLEDRNYWYFSNRPFAHHVDHWYWEWIANYLSRKHYFTVDHLATGPYTTTLTFNLLGYFNTRHHVTIYINDQVVYDDTPWSGTTPYTITVSFPQSYLQEGRNKITVKLDPGWTDKVYLNWIEVTYFDTLVAENSTLAFRQSAQPAGPRQFVVTQFHAPDIAVYDVTHPFQVQRIQQAAVSGTGPYTLTFRDTVGSDSRYLALTPDRWLAPDDLRRVEHLNSPYTPADLLDPNNQAEYILITHRAFWDQAMQLAHYRSSSFHVALVDVQEIYNQFNGGMMSAEAIHDFLDYAYHSWQRPAPQFVLLMGDGSYDLRKYRASSPTSFIPPYLYLADPTLGETAADNRFVTVEGNDILPDMALGRLPANTPAEAQAMVDKIIKYETQCKCDQWNYNTLFVSDDLEGGGGNFYDYSDRIADGYVDIPTGTVKLLPGTYSITKAYLGQTCDIDGNPDRANQCREEITTTLNITGALFINYVGHSTVTYWAEEHLLDQGLLAQLANGPCLPISLEMTCYTGSYHDISYDSLAEVAVRLPEHGVIASWAATGFGLVSGHDALEKGLILALFYEGEKRLGPATVRGKAYLMQESPQDSDLVDTFILLGDPALKVKTNQVCSEIPTAIQMADFAASVQDGRSRVIWQTMAESDILGFQLYRRLLQPGTSTSYQRITSDVIPAQASGTPLGASYQYLDEDVLPGRAYQYELEVLGLDGQITRYGPTAIIRIPPPTTDHPILQPTPPKSLP